MSEDQMRQAECTLIDELSDVVLLDIEVENADENFDVGDFKQPASDQAPYLDAYLTPDGNRILSWFKPPSENSFRIVFFLHFFDPSKTLLSSYGELKIPPIQEMPPHLEELIPYEPAD